MLRRSLLIALRVGLGLTALSPFLGWLRWGGLDPSVAMLPIPLQLLRIFLITGLVSFAVQMLAALCRLWWKRRR